MSLAALLKSATPRVLRERYWAWDNQVRLAAERELFHHAKGRILGGPFRGLHYVDAAAGSALSPKLLGIYERELGAVVESIIARPPSLIIDVGAAEGYYAVGLLSRCPATRCIAFEATDSGRALMERLAALNGVANRLNVRGYADPQALRDALELGEQGSVVIVDVEGFEVQLLNPDAAPALRTSYILVELHEALAPGCRAALESRFVVSHQLDLIASEPRSLAEVKSLGVAMPDWRLKKILRERPHLMHWLWMTPRHVNPVRA